MPNLIKDIGVKINAQYHYEYVPPPFCHCNERYALQRFQLRLKRMVIAAATQQAATALRGKLPFYLEIV